MLSRAVVWCFIFCCVSVFAQQIQVTTIAGLPSNYGDGSIALQANLFYPTKVLFVQHGILVVDYQNSQVRQIFTNGTIVTIAGKNAVAGYNGEGISAVSAYLRNPSSIATTSSNEILITDTGNSIIRKISLNGTISTVAGVPNSAGYTADGSLAIHAMLSAPYGIAVNSKNEIIFSEQQNHVIRKILQNGTLITIAGTTIAGLGCDNCPALTSQLNYPSDIFITPQDVLYVADTSNHLIKKIENDTITRVVGSSSQINPVELKSPYGVAVSASSGTMYIAEARNHAVRKIFTNGTNSIAAGVLGTRGYNGEGPISTSLLNYPLGVAVDSDENLLVSSPLSNTIFKVMNHGSNLIRVAGLGPSGYGNVGNLANQINMQPTKCRPLNQNEFIIADSVNHVVRKINSDKTTTIIAGKLHQSGYNGDNLLATETLFNNVYSVFVHGLETFIVDRENHLVRKIGANGNVTIVAGVPMQSGDSGDNGPSINAQLNSPTDVFVTSTNEIYIADSANHAIRKIVNGTITTIAGALGLFGYSGDGGLATAAKLNNPTSVFVTAQNEIYIADSSNSAIRKIFSNGTITTVAGSGVSGFEGDGGKATSAKISDSNAIFVTSNGELYIADSNNYVIRKVNTNGIISTIAGIPMVAGYSGENVSPSQALFNFITDIWITSDAMYTVDASFLVKKISASGVQPSPSSVIVNHATQIIQSTLVFVILLLWV